MVCRFEIEVGEIVSPANNKYELWTRSFQIRSGDYFDLRSNFAHLLKFVSRDYDSEKKFIFSRNK